MHNLAFYMVTLVTTNPLCGSAITQAVNVIFTSVNKMIEDEVWVEVFPNPVYDYISINFLGNEGLKKLRIYSSTGQNYFDRPTYRKRKSKNRFFSISTRNVLAGNCNWKQNLH